MDKVYHNCRLPCHPVSSSLRFAQMLSISFHGGSGEMERTKSEGPSRRARPGGFVFHRGCEGDEKRKTIAHFGPKKKKGYGLLSISFHKGSGEMERTNRHGRLISFHGFAQSISFHSF